jgi:hypothetical protein
METLVELHHLRLIRDANYNIENTVSLVRRSAVQHRPAMD